jgi:hypothetical protein
MTLEMKSKKNPSYVIICVGYADDKVNFVGVKTCFWIEDCLKYLTEIWFSCVCLL